MAAPKKAAKPAKTKKGSSDSSESTAIQVKVHKSKKVAKTKPKTSSGKSTKSKEPASSSLSVPLPDKLPIEVPELPKTPLTHKVIPISDSNEDVINDVQPDAATPRRKIMPLSDQEQEKIDSFEGPLTNSGAPEPEEEDVFEEILDTFNESEDVKGVDAPIDTGSLDPELEEETPEPDDDSVNDEEDEDMQSESAEPELSVGDADEKYKTGKVSSSVSSTTKKQVIHEEEVAQEEESNSDEELDMDAAPLPLKLDKKYKVNIKDRRGRRKNMYVVELLFVVVLSIIFVGILIDAEIVDFGVQLPFDLL